MLLALALLLAPVSLGAPWKDVAPGVQSAPASELGGDAAWQARVVLIDPQKVRFLVRYDASRPTLAEWQKRYPSALAVLNGSFYSVESAEVKPTCDLVSDGKPVRGAGCKRQDALYFGARPALMPRESALFSKPVPRWKPQLLAPAEFRADEWAEALKSFPALVRAGAPACGGAHYCAESSRTAALAQLKDGRILLFASQWPAVRREVGEWLAGQLGAVDALNLDGGPEATLAVRGEGIEEAIGTPNVGLPMVLLVVPGP
jgi:exopolysaccharide biosynthesis protein